MICQADERVRATCFIQILACPLQVSADSVLALLCETLGYIFMHAHTDCIRLPWVASPDARLVRAVAKRRPHRLPVNNYLFMLRPLPPSLPLVVPGLPRGETLGAVSPVSQLRFVLDVQLASQAEVTAIWKTPPAPPCIYFFTIDGAQRQIVGFWSASHMHCLTTMSFYVV